MTSFVVYLFGSGLAFFVGAGLLLLAIALGASRRSPVLRGAILASCIGLVLIAASAAPLPTWYYVVAILVTANWLYAVRKVGDNSRVYRNGSQLAAGAIWLAAIGVELPYQFVPTVAPITARHIDLFGDSIAAGIGSHEDENWPNILANEHQLEIANHAAAGATVADMLRSAQSVELPVGLVLLEIGGNDLLGKTPCNDFERDLDTLLTCVCAGDRQVVMFELPLPPTYNQFGQAQRRIAGKHHVKLLPKRLLMGVLTRGGATLDSLHLSRDGHQQMATVVWSAIQPAFPN
jgi:acyl-CoA thioesterase-1